MEKEQFVKILTDLKNKRRDWEKLTEALETLSPNEYVNFWPYFFYEDIIRELLNSIFHFTDEESPISYFMIEGNFGDDKQIFICGDETFDISTPDKLFDTCIKLI